MGIFDKFKKDDVFFKNEIDKYQIDNYENGAYRKVLNNEMLLIDEFLKDAYPNFYGKVIPFGISWMGNIFAVDLRNLNKGNILLFEIGTADVLEIPCNIQQFFLNEIRNEPDACLALSFYNEWLNNGGQMVDLEHCIGYKIPLFLDGEDELFNLEFSDIKVYWHLMKQVIKNNK